MIGKAIRGLAAKVPEHSNLAYMALAVGAAAAAAPALGLAIPETTLWVPQPFPTIAEAGLGLVTVGLEAMILSKMAVKNRWQMATASKVPKKLEISLGGMTFDEKALFTNLIAFGSIGSGKTAAVIYPILDALTALYGNNDPTMPNAKWGGFVLDVKGDFHEALIYVMQKHGRDILNDLVVIRPDNDYYILEFEDIHTKEHFLVSCMGGTSMQECDLVLAKAEGPETILGDDLSHNKVLRLPNGDCEPLSSFVFNDRGTFRRKDVNDRLRELEFDVLGLSVRWLGWREDKSGRLVRVTNTHNRKPRYGVDDAGNPITTAKPTRLRYIGVHSINNGLTYNLISKNAASTEAAGRIMAVAEVTGNAFGSDNAYWSNASEKHIAACIELFRQVEGPGGKECSVNEIQIFTTNEQYLTKYVNKLKKVITSKQVEGASPYEILLLRNLDDYFTGEWLKHDPKTKGNIQSCVTNLFGDVTRNEQLIKTFCQPSRFSFEDCLNNGKVYTLVLSAYPNAQMLIGTCMKLDFQQVVLKRTQAAPVNKNRFLLFLADEYQFFITTSGGGKTGGDEKFLSVARQSRICNLIATQAKSTLLAVQKDENKIDAFIQCFGSRVFLQNLDDKTNKLAEQTCGQFWGEKADHSGADLKLSSAFGEGRSGSTTRRQEKMNRFDASHFTQMAPFESVIYNKERPTGSKIVKANLKETARFWDKKALSHAANDYYQAYIENRAFELGIAHLFDLHHNVRDRGYLEARLPQGANLAEVDALVSASEAEQRDKGILRGWRFGLPIRQAVISDSDPNIPNEKAEDQDGSATGGGQDDPEERKEKDYEDGYRRDMNALPSFNDLKDYSNSVLPFASDLLASRESDPFFSRTDQTARVITDEEEKQPGSAGTAEGAAKAAETGKGSWENNLNKGLDELPKTPLDQQIVDDKDRLSNQTTIPDGIKPDGEIDKGATAEKAEGDQASKKLNEGLDRPKLPLDKQVPDDELERLSNQVNVPDGINPEGNIEKAPEPPAGTGASPLANLFDIPDNIGNDSHV
jgi:hypothetical protein